MRKVLEDVKEKAKEELKLLCKKQALTKDEVQCMGEYVDMLKDVAEVCGMSEFFDFDEGYSGAPYGVHMPHVDYDGVSHRRGRSPSTGRFVSRDAGPMWNHDGEYSGHLKKDEVIKELEEAYDNAVTDSQREFIKKMIKRFERK